MLAPTTCLDCMFKKQSERFSKKANEQVFSSRLWDIVYNIGSKQTVTEILLNCDALYVELFGSKEDLTLLKAKYNNLLLEKQVFFEDIISKSENEIKSALQFAVACNYIDFGTTKAVNDDFLNTLLNTAGTLILCDDEIKRFKAELSKAKTMVYFLDNCGEIVLDMVLMKTIKKLYPTIKIYAMVRGGNVLNDVTMVDAVQVGLDKVVTVIDNNCSAAGVILERLSIENYNLIKNADVILSKGQGNFESLFGTEVNPYYLFLCKCHLFVKRFNMELYSPIFSKGERIKINEE